MATQQPGWIGRALRPVVGAIFMWVGIKELRLAQWVLEGLLLGALITLVHTLGLFAFEVLTKRVSKLSSVQLYVWNHVYYISAWVALYLWRGTHAWAGTVVFSLGMAMALAFLFRYGGCEIMAVPNLILHRDYVVFCGLFSPIDRLEQVLVDRLSGR